MKKFFAGYLAYAAIHSLQQDLMGMENYIALVRVAWASAWITVPMAIIMIICSIFLYHSKESS